MSRRSRAEPPSPFRYFNSSTEMIRLLVMMYLRSPLSLRNVEDLLFERGIDICHETVRQWWNRFGPLFAGDIRRQRVSRMRGFRQWRWHLDEVYVEVLESYVTKIRDKKAARFHEKALKRHGSPEAITTDGLRSYRAALVADPGELGCDPQRPIRIVWRRVRIRLTAPIVVSLAPWHPTVTSFAQGRASAFVNCFRLA